MLTLHAMGWNEKKNLSLHQALSTRYVKVSLLLIVLCVLLLCLLGLLLIIQSFNPYYCITVHQTCQRLKDETARLADLKTELDCTDEVVSQWLSDVKEWAAGGKHDQIKETTNIPFYNLNFMFDIKEQQKIVGGSSSNVMPHLCQVY